jgi:hypothetical protein
MAAMSRSTVRRAIFLSGLALVVGFFLPWLDLGGPFRASGFDAVWNANGITAFRVMMLMVPIGGLAMMLSAAIQSRYARLISLGTGACLGAFGVYKALELFFRVTGWGLWIVLAAATVAVLAPLLVRPSE